MDLTREERMQTKKVLEGARALISDPERWVSGWIGVNRFGVETMPDDPACRRWCAFGAISKASGAEMTVALRNVLESTCEDIIKENDGFGVVDDLDVIADPIIVLNDEVARHELVIEAFDRAIEEVT